MREGGSSRVRISIAHCPRGCNVGSSLYQHGLTLIGLPVNLRHHPDIGGRHPATDLSSEGAGAIEASAALETLAMAFAERRGEWLQGGFEGVRNAWLKHAYGLGQTAQIKLENASHSGSFIGIDESGALRLKDDDCAEQQFAAGEVTFEESS